MSLAQLQILIASLSVESVLDSRSIATLLAIELIIDALGQVHWLLTHDIRASIRRCETVVTSSHTIMVDLNIGQLCVHVGVHSQQVVDALQWGHL